MRKKLFEYAILLHPTDDESKKGEATKLIGKPDFVMATDLQGATLLAARQIPEGHLAAIDRIEVAVRPF